ncbi:MAG: hypothetical protein JO084_04865 [Bradyrhizobiaceae bacterium]|nr:hypothetical protein [Bradyrhizobiaceae bacterium]
MTRSAYALTLSAKVIEAARSGVAEQLHRDLPPMQEPPAELSELIARLAALDSVEQRAAERLALASLPLQLPLPKGTPPRS